MKNTNKLLIRRGIGYLLGFALLYSPFALLQVFLIKVFKLAGSEGIHGACFRIPIQNIANGKGLGLLTTTGTITFAVLLVAFFFGPQFCGKLCIAGALPEFAGKIVPDKLKIDWQKYIPSAPVRYGLLAGFLISPALGLSVASPYCNYILVEDLVMGGINLNMAIWGSTAILTAFVWLFVLGIFSKGGRGYCTYLCPFGAAQSILQRIGVIIPFTYKLKFDKEKCVSCGICQKECPTRAINMSENLPTYNIHNCIACSQCSYLCPKKAITYGSGKDAWAGKQIEQPVLDKEEVAI